MKVRDILRAKGATLYTVSPTTLLSTCVIHMAEEDIGSVVVVDDSRVVGILTFREVIQVLANRHSKWRDSAAPLVAQMQVQSVMRRKPVVTTLDTDLHELREQMLGDHQRYLPVLDGATLVGVISLHDVARAVVEEQAFENSMLKAYIHDRPAEALAEV
jgi:CBS domain-containing protein